jgi:hypothetical protein
MTAALFYGIVAPLALAISMASPSHPCAGRHVIVVSRIVAIERHLMRVAFVHAGSRGHESPLH